MYVPSVPDSTGTANYTYNAFGDLTSETKGDTLKAYTYDLLGRPLSFTLDNGDVHYLSTFRFCHHKYDRKCTSPLSPIYDGSNVVADINDTATYFVRGNGLALLKDNSGTYLYTLTPRGDVRKVYKSKSDVNDYIYTAYGESAGDNVHTVNPFGYTGEYTDYETGLIYLRNRYYDAELGMFITEDPICSGTNWYVYANNNPINYIDPLGLDSYVFYAKGVMAGDGIHTFEDEANIWAEDLKEEYKTKVHTIEVSSAKDFAEKWNKMGDNKKGIDGVVLIFHGSVDDGINGNGEKGGVGYMYVNNKNDRIIAKDDIAKNKNNVEISSLDSKNIKKLIFSSCNSGNPDVYNVAYAFMKANNIENKVIAWDGGTIFNYETETLEAGGPRSNQHTWKKYVKKKFFFFPVRERIGKRVLKDEY